MTYNKLQMPPRYYPDSVIKSNIKGHVIYDTIFHTIHNIPLIDIASNQLIMMDTLLYYQINLLYIAPIANHFTLHTLQQLTRLKQQLRINSFLHILCLTDRELPASYMMPGIQYYRFLDTLQSNQFCKHVLKLNISIHQLPFVVLIDKNKIIRNYYILSSSTEDKLLQDVILLNLEK